MGEIKVAILNDAEFDLFRTQIQAVMEKDLTAWQPFMSVSDAIKCIEDCTYHVWAGWRNGAEHIEMWAVTEHISTPKCSLLRIAWCGGCNVQDYCVTFLEAVERLAAILKVDYVEVTGRQAWHKIFAPLGFKFRSVTLLKKVNHEQQPSEECNADQCHAVDAGTESGDQQGHGTG